MTIAAEIPAAPIRSLAAGRVRRTRRYLMVVAGLLVVNAALGLILLLSGEEHYSLGQVATVLAGGEVPGASFVIGELRAPRLAVGALAGVAFGMSGAASQSLLRNQLASPDIIGITSGASAAAVFAILVLGWTGLAVNIAAVVCGLLTAIVIFLLSGRGSMMGGRLILIGIGISAMLGSVISYLQLRAPAYEVGSSLRWLSGSLNSASPQQVPVLAAAVVIFGAALLILSRELRVLQLGDEAATALGTRLHPVQLGLIVCLVALSAFATAAVGPIAFVSFLAGPIAKRLTGPGDNNPLVPAGLMGMLLVLAADWIAQYVLAYSYPVGVVTGLVGAPYLLVLLVRMNKKGAMA